MWEDKVLCAQKRKTGQTGRTVILARQMQLFSYKKKSVIANSRNIPVIYSKGETREPL